MHDIKIDKLKRTTILVADKTVSRWPIAGMRREAKTL
jgi:hypothetical protein